MFDTFTAVFYTNTVMFYTFTAVFYTNTVMFDTFTVVFDTNTVVFDTFTVVFDTFTVEFDTNTVMFDTFTAVFDTNSTNCNIQRTYILPTSLINSKSKAPIDCLPASTRRRRGELPTISFTAQPCTKLLASR